MQNPKIMKAAKARLKQAKAHAKEISLLLFNLSRGDAPESRMPKLRILCASLSQAVHEFNAYHNAANTH